MKFNQLALLGLAGLLAAACSDDEVEATKGALAVTVQLASDLTDVTTVQISALVADSKGNFTPAAEDAESSEALATIEVSDTTLASAVIDGLKAGSYRFVATAYAGDVTVAGATASLDVTVVADGVAIAAFSLGGSTELMIGGITASNGAPKTGDVVTLTATVSGNAGGSLLWTDNCDGDFVTNGAASVQWSSTFVESCTITLNATNPVTSSTATLALSVGGQKGSLERVVGNGSCVQRGYDEYKSAVLTGTETADTVHLTKLNGLAMDAAGNLVFPEQMGGRVWRWNPRTDALTRVAGAIDNNRDGEGSSGDDGPALDATFYYPFDVDFGPDGDIYVVDAWEYEVRRIYADSATITTVPISLTSYSTGIAVDSNGDVFAANAYSSEFVQKYYASSGTEFTLNSEDSWDIEISGSDVFVTNRFEHAVYKMPKAGGAVTYIAGDRGNGGYSGDGGTANEATLFDPRGLFVDANGNIFVADGGNGVIRKITSAGQISTVVDVQGTPGDVVIDPDSSDMYYTDRDSCSIFKVYGPY